MSITVDIDVERRINQELGRGRFAGVNELMAHAIGLVEAEDLERAEGEQWLVRNQEFVRQALAESFAAKERGESYSPEDAKALLIERRAARSTHPA